MVPVSAETKGTGPGAASLMRWEVPAIAVLAILLYLPSLGGSFVNWDDEWLIVNNPLIDGVDDLAWILDPTSWREPLGAEYLPVRDLSIWLDYRLWGPSPLGYHLENALLYGLVCALALFVLRDLTQSRRAALIGTLLFLVHPVHVESVAWVSERKGLLAAFFLLAAWLAYRRSRSGRHAGWLAGAAVLFLLAALSKSTVHFFGLLVPAVELFEARRENRPVPWWNLLLSTCVFLAISATAVAFNARHQAAVGASYGWEGESPLSAVLVVASTALGYIRLMLVPTGLSVEYENASPLVGWVGIPVLAALMIATAVALRRGSRYSPSAMFALLAWLPVSNVIPLPNRMADRYVFLISLGVAGVVGLALEALIGGGRKRRRAGWAALGLVVVAFGSLAVGRMAVWRDSLALWQDAAEKAPRSARVQQNLGVVLLRDGQTGPAFECFQRMLDHEPEVGAWWTFVAKQHEAAGNLTAAEAHLREGMRLDQTDASSRINLAMLLLTHSGGSRHSAIMIGEAKQLLLEVTRGGDTGLGTEGTRAIAHLNLGSLHFMQGRMPEGIDHTRRALESGASPRDERLALENLVRAYRQLGRESEACRCEAQLVELERRLLPLAPK
jgi:protein O-mannosyl-transferase